MIRLYHFLDRHPLISGPLLGLAFGAAYVIIKELPCFS